MRLVEGGPTAPDLVLVGRPEPARVGPKNLVDEGEVSVPYGADLELGAGDEEPLLAAEAPSIA